VWARVVAWAAGIGPLRRAVRGAKRARRRVFERCGSDRYSHPAYDDLDRKLARYLPHRGGVFVEAGAFDGYWGSNTYWFERFRGWSGVLVEPVTELAARARKERPRSRVFECALVPPDFPDDRLVLRYRGTMTVAVDLDGGEMHAERQVTREPGQRDAFEFAADARCLGDVLDEAAVGRIDLLSLDVEGYEAPVLRGLDLRRHRPRFVLVEMLKEEPARREIESVLGADYAYEARLSGRDHLYRRVT
jgi:FkbM family methyltransferase